MSNYLKYEKMEGILLKIKHLFVVAACSIAAISSFVVSANYNSGSIGNSDANITGSARMDYYSSSKDLCVLTAALGGSSRDAASGSVSGKIQGIDVKPIYIGSVTLNKNRYSYSTSKTVSDDYDVMTVTISLGGVSKNIYAYD
ncbi:MAG: hypothetical protein J6L77_08415 [Coprococcus sp.]|nr:hypothetical protein [Coprococcus sp.]